MTKKSLLSFLLTSFIGAGLCYALDPLEEKAPINTMSKLSDNGYFLFDETEDNVNVRKKINEYPSMPCTKEFFQEFSVPNDCI